MLLKFLLIYWLFTEEVRKVLWARRVVQTQKDKFSLDSFGFKLLVSLRSPQESFRNSTSSLRGESPHWCFQQHTDNTWYGWYCIIKANFCIERARILVKYSEVGEIFSRFFCLGSFLSRPCRTDRNGISWKCWAFKGTVEVLTRTTKVDIFYFIVIRRILGHSLAIGSHCHLF